MKYYDDFESQDNGYLQGYININSDYKSAKITINDEIFNICGNKNINRVFNGDLVTLKKKDGINKIVNQVKTEIKKKKIIGVLYVKSKTIIGCNKKGVPIYIFRPLSL